MTAHEFVVEIAGLVLQVIMLGAAGLLGFALLKEITR